MGHACFSKKGPLLPHPPARAPPRVAVPRTPDWQNSRYRTAPRPVFDKADRDAILKLHNDLPGSLVAQDHSGRADKISPELCTSNSRYKAAPSAVFDQADRDEITKQNNRVGGTVFRDRSGPMSTLDHYSKDYTKVDSRFGGVLELAVPLVVSGAGF